MARSDYVGAVKENLYNTGMGEKPSLRRVAADAGVAGTGVVMFDLAAGEGDKVKAGDVLAFVSENDKDEAYTFYVLSVATDVVTAVNAYRGSPLILGSSTDMDGGVLEQNPLVPEFTIHRAIDTIFGKYLYPEAMKPVSTRTITPNLSTYRSEIPADVENIRRAYQIIGTQLYDVGIEVHKDLPSGLSSTGSLALYEPSDGSTIYLVTEERLAIGDEDTFDGLVDMVAAGATALCLSASVAGASQERAKKDAQQRDIRAGEFWSTFLLARASWRQDVGHDNDFFKINLG